MRLLSIAIVWLLSNVYSYKIFVYSPRFAHSHTTFMGRIADTLVEHGHDVTVLQPIINPYLANKTGVSLAKLITVPQNKEINDVWHEVIGEFRDPWTHEPKFPVLTRAGLIYAGQCDYTLNQTELLDQLRNEKFDVGLAEGYDHCGPALLKVIGTKSRIILASTTGMDSVNAFIGVPNILSYVPTASAKVPDEMDFKGRIHNIIVQIGIRYYYHVARVEVNKILDKHFGPEFPRVQELIGTSDLYFTNSHPYLDFPHPTLEKIVDLGGIGVHKPKPLNSYWEEVVNRRPNTVFISFGSIANSKNLPLEWKQSLLQTMKNMHNVTFIWKYENIHDSFASGVENVVLSDWAPQVDLLNHPRVSAFVTHGGLGSVMEVATAGKPALLVPLFADQHRNALMCERKGFSINIKKEELGNPEKLTAHLQQLVFNEKYLHLGKLTAKRLARRPFTATELLVKNVELAADLGDLSFLEPIGRKLTFVQYHNLDVIGLFVTILILLLSILFFVARFVLRFASRIVCGSKTKQD